jgi:glycosyltransferase involved in cell wall biosynthesis
MSMGDGFSVVIPAKNGMPDVLDAVGSALAQDPPPDEVVIAEDGSTDGTAEALRARFGDSVRILSDHYGSAAAARNAGWRAARSPWIALLDADDLWFAGKLARAREHLARTPEAAWFFSDGAFRTLDGEWHTSWFALYAELPDHYVGQPVGELMDVNFILTSSVVIRRDALEAVGGFDTRLTHAEDLDLWIRLARRWPAVATREALVRYQHRPGGLTRQVEARLGGDVDLFGRLARDPSLPPELRRRARRRASLASLKLAVVALREGRRAEARRRLGQAWMFPERALPVLATWAATLLPEFGLAALRRHGWTKRTVAAPMVRMRRVVLHGAEPPSRGAPGARGAA